MKSFEKISLPSGFKEIQLNESSHYTYTIYESVYDVFWWMIKTIRYHSISDITESILRANLREDARFLWQLPTVEEVTRVYQILPLHKDEWYLAKNNTIFMINSKCNSQLQFDDDEEEEDFFANKYNVLLISENLKFKQPTIKTKYEFF